MSIQLDRRQFLRGGLAMTGLGLLAGCSGLNLPWQQQARVTRIGYLGGGTSGPYPVFLDAFRQAMRELGYVEGENITIEYRFVDGALGRAPAMAAELVALKLDVIVANGSAQVEAARVASNVVPIVGVPLGGDPVRVGLVASLARPGGNVTGLSTVASGTVAKRLQFLREVAPGLDRVAVLWNAGNSTKAAEYAEAEGAAATLGLRLLSAEVRGPGDFDGAFQAVTASGAGALMVLADPLVNGHGAQIAAVALRQRLPSMFEPRDGTDAGGLMNYGPSVIDLYRRAAIYVDKIVKGIAPAEIPVEQPTTFDVVINLRTADALGLTLPPSVLQEASELIR